LRIWLSDDVILREKSLVLFIVFNWSLGKMAYFGQWK